MSFRVLGNFQIRFTPREDLRRLEASVDLSRIPATRELNQLLQLCISGEATHAENQWFGESWQDLVRRLLLEHGEDPEVFKMVRCR